MAKHVWLTRPTPTRAAKMKTAWEVARERLITSGPYRPGWARVFAGYYVEQVSKGRNIPVRPLLSQVCRGGWKIMRSVNTFNYELAFVQCLPILVSTYAVAVSLKPDTPWQMVADKMMEGGAEALALDLAAMHEDLREDLHLLLKQSHEFNSKEAALRRGEPA